MKIGQGSGSTPWNTTSGGRVETGSKNAPAQAGASNVSISSLSGQLHEMQADLSRGVGFDAARVESIKTAIRAGEFRVNPAKVADKLIDSVRELVGK
ncbi:MAG: flagellar biosynthesis anti-sigma factor FlgM [Burkholderiales bacterium]